MEVASAKNEEKSFSQSFTFRNNGMGLYSCEKGKSGASSLSIIVKSKGQLVCKIIGLEDELVDVQFTWANNEKTSFLIGTTFYTRVFHPQFPSLDSMNEMVQQTYRDSISKYNLSEEIIGPFLTLKKYHDLENDGNPDLEALFSRNLIAILRGAPHAVPYGIVQISNQFDDDGLVPFRNDTFLIEESLDMLSVYSLCQKAYEASEECRTKDFLLNDFRLKWNALIERMKSINIGGNFELTNLGYRKSDYFQHVFVLKGGSILPFVDLEKNYNSYKPITWENWITLNVGEDNENLVCSYNFMLSRQFGNNEGENETIVLHQKKEDNDCIVS